MKCLDTKSMFKKISNELNYK